MSYRIAMKYVYAFAILACATAIAEGIQCVPGICSRAPCDNVPESVCLASGRIYKEEGGFCGCCSACLEKLREGDNCGINDLLVGLPPVAVCEPSTTCREVKVRKCVRDDF